MRSLILLMTLLALPPLMIVVHDLYVTFYDIKLEYDGGVEMGVKVEEKTGRPLSLSGVGTLLNLYAPEYLQAIHDSVDKEQWDTMVKPILRAPAAILSAGPFALVSFYLALAWLFGLPPYTRESGFLSGKIAAATRPGSSLSRDSRGKMAKFQYKRR